MGAPGWSRLDIRSVLTVVAPTTPGATGSTGLAGRLQSHYAGLEPHRSAVVAEGAGYVVVVTSRTSVAGEAPTLPMVWGNPIGASGVATDAELSAFAAEPRRSPTLLGRYVAVTADGAGVRLTTSPDLAHTLSAASGK